MKMGAGLFALVIAFGSLAGFSGSAQAASLRASGEASVKDSSHDWSQSWRGWYGSRPSIKDVDPERGSVGTTVTLSGKKFTDESVVHFGQGIIDEVEVSEDGKTLSFVVPETMDRYCVIKRFCTQATVEVEPANYRMSVQNGYRFSNTVMFEVLGTTTPPSDEPVVITEVDGPTALESGVEGVWTVAVAYDGDASLRYSVKWGDEGNFLTRLFTSDEAMQSSATFTHTYSEPGTYEPEFTVRDMDGNTAVTYAKKVVVADTVAVPHITSVSPDSVKAKAEVTVTGTGFDSNSTVSVGTVRATDVVVHSDTKITFTVPEMSAATYSVTVSDNDGVSNQMDLTVVAQKGKVSINGIDAPTRLSVGEVGTWTVEAASNLSGKLKYSVDWGVDRVMARGLEAFDTITTQSSATFTNVYDTVGTFKPKFMVEDEQGNTATVSASVLVDALVE